MPDKPFIIGAYSVSHRTSETLGDRYSGLRRGINGRKESTVVNATDDRQSVMLEVLRRAANDDADLSECIAILSDSHSATQIREYRERVAAARRLLTQVLPGDLGVDLPLPQLCERVAAYVSGVIHEADIKGGFDLPTPPDMAMLESQIQIRDEHIGTLERAMDDLRVERDKATQALYLLRQRIDIESDATAIRDKIERLHGEVGLPDYVVLDDVNQSVIVGTNQTPVFSWEAVRKAMDGRDRPYSIDDERVDCLLAEFVQTTYSTLTEQDFPMSQDPDIIRGELDSLKRIIGQFAIDADSYRTVQDVCSLVFDDSNEFDAVDAGYAVAVISDVLAPDGVMQEHARDGVFLALEHGDNDDLTLAITNLLNHV